MYSRYDFDQRSDAYLRGSDVLQKLPQEKIVWDPGNYNFADLSTNASLLRFCQKHPWTKMGNAVLQKLGVVVPRVPKRALLIEYGSSHNVAWVREDLKLLKVISLIPNGVGVIMLSNGNGSLEESLGVSRSKALTAFKELFPPGILWQAPAKASLPKREKLLEAYASLGISEGLKVIAAVYDEVSKNRGTWADFVAVYRYVIAQLINMRFGSKVPLVIVSLEDFLVQTNRLKGISISEYLSALRQSLGGDFAWVREVRALNYPCQHCQGWHFVTSKGNCWQGQGQSVKKKCRLKNFGQTKLNKVLEQGAGLSGAGIYMAFGELGGQSAICTLARDYSKGKVFQILENYLKHEANGLHLLPVGSFHLYSEGNESGISVDSLVFWEYLRRLGGKASSEFAQIWQALPVPFTRRGEETHIRLCMNGRLEITRR